MMIQPDTADAKGRILSHAIELFRSSGFAHVSVEEITSGVGMSKKTFYKHFDSKHDLIRQIVERIVGELHVRIRAIVESDQPFLQKLNRLSSLITARFKTLSAPLLRDIQIHSPESWTYIQDFRRDKILTAWGSLIEQGKREGLIRPDVNSRLFVLSLLGVVEHVVDPAVLANESFSADEALKDIVQMFSCGILTEQAVHQLHALQLEPQS
ncbi:MAG TPA: TetR/AcrR family transcriptional regulator [Bacteroidota bacterium]|nr:TetR/AcrR family transcriptional regulator [Bacteroidota bacterium]